MSLSGSGPDGEAGHVAFSMGFPPALYMWWERAGGKPVENAAPGLQRGRSPASPLG